MKFSDNLLKYKDRKYVGLVKNNFDEFYKAIEDVYNSKGYSDIIYIIKISRLYVDPFCSNKLVKKQKKFNNYWGMFYLLKSIDFSKRKLIR